MLTSQKYVLLYFCYLDIFANLIEIKWKNGVNFWIDL